MTWSRHRSHAQVKKKALGGNLAAGLWLSEAPHERTWSEELRKGQSHRFEPWSLETWFEGSTYA
jgi:hypothetical protein